MNFMERITGAITKPDDAMKEINMEPRIEEGLMLVGIYMILTVLSTYIAFTRVVYTGSAAGVEASSLSTVMLVGELAVAIVGPLVSWPVVAGVAHYLSLFFGGDGKFYPNMMTLIGYTCIPLIVMTVISAPLALLTPVTTLDLSASAQAATSSILSNPIQILGMILGLAGSLWAAYIGVFAVKNGEKLPMNNAMIVIGVLFVLNLLISYGSMALALLSG